MADDDFGDAELWAAIDSAAAARYAPASTHSAISSPQSNRSLVLSRFQQQQSPHGHRFPLVELPTSPQTEAAIVPRDFRGRVSAEEQLKENVGVGFKRQPQQMQQHFQDGHVAVRQKQNNGQQRFSGSNRSALQEMPSKDYDSNWLLQNMPPQSIQSMQTMLSPWINGIPSSSVFKHLQDAAMRVLEKGDFIMMQGKPFIKKSGWRKIAFFFNISFEIKDRKIEFDQGGAVLRAEFVIRATMQSGRFSDGWGSCDLREKRFSKPNHDIPSTAETRAKTRACQDLLGIGEYKPGSDNW